MLGLLKDVGQATERPSRIWSPAILLVATVAALCRMATAADAPVPVPASVALPMSTPSGGGPYSSYPAFPFLRASRLMVPQDLAKSGYTEDEFLISGKANVYDWAPDGALSVKTPDASYTTRILVRHPSDPAKFSGTVVVEIMNAARTWDWSMMWGYLWPQIMEHGDAWVGVTMPGGVPGLKKYDHGRYGSVSFRNPVKGACPNGNPMAETEDGLKWDMLSQVAAALKSDAAARPLAGFRVDYLYMTTQGADVVTYITAIQPHAKLANGKPAYDGFLIKSVTGPGRINQCGAPLAKSDPRYVIRNAGVPVITVQAQSEVLGGLAARRPDSDDPGDRYRLYEIAGAEHLDIYPYQVFPNFVDQTVAGNAQGTPEWPFGVRCTPEIELNETPLLNYSFHAALANLDQWVRKGVAPPKANRVQVKDQDTDRPSVVLDQHGNGVGGVRTFFVDFPAATYIMSSPGPGVCAEMGRTVPFDWARLDTLYGSYKSYAGKVSQSVDRSVKERWLTDYDARKIKTELKVKTETTVSPTAARAGASQ
jgi:Alpha/beta hydrolase domain